MRKTDSKSLFLQIQEKKYKMLLTTYFYHPSVYETKIYIYINIFSIFLGHIFSTSIHVFNFFPIVEA